MNRLMVFISLAALTIAGCGDGDNDAAPLPTPPATSELVSVGTISGFGSVISNGIEFDTWAAEVRMDGQPATVDDLHVGMVVTIRGTLHNGTGMAVARDIHFSDDAQGPITSIDPINNSIVVLGRTVFLDELTVFDKASLDDLAVGNMVQVSGQWRSQERIQATHVERLANAYSNGMQMEVKGLISDLDLAAQRFNIGTQVCDYSLAMLDLGTATLANGLYVEVSSTLPLVNGDLILDRIQARDRDRDRDQLCDSGCDFDLEGYVTAFVSPMEFEVDGAPVSTTSSTVYVNGTVATLALDVKVAVIGTLDDAGVLIAERIVFHMPALIEIEADIESIDLDNSIVTVLGIPVTTNELTFLHDHSNAGTREFDLGDLAIGDRVEIRAYLDGSTVVARRLERDDADDDVTLKALVDAFSQPDVTLLGVTVMTDDETVFQNAAMEVIDADAFFALLDTDSLVRAVGTYDGTSILASKLSLRTCQMSCM